MMYGSQGSPELAFEQMDWSLEQGINLFDCAEIYSVPPTPQTQGRTEEIIGDWFASRGSRDKVVLASKVTGRSDQSWLRKAGGDTRITPAQLDEALEGSLRRLKTDRIDLYQLHWPDRDVNKWGTLVHVDYPNDFADFGDTLAHLGRHVEKGNIRHIGVSNETAWGVMKFLAASDTRGLPRIASIQNAYSLINRTFELGLSEVALQEQVGLLAYSVLGQGHLSGKYQNGALPAGARKTLYGRMQRYEKPGVTETIQAYLDLAARFGVDPVALAIRFVASRPFVTSTLVGGSSMAQLKADVAALDIDWTQAMAEAVDDIHNHHPNPCP
jgi:aryl-alcohol dehydrogenase-like predicted oxidoreductase